MIRSLLYFMLLGVFVLGAADRVYADAPSPAASSCDPKYYNTLESRAWLEAQREITQNQNLISKPDSVLRYSCFNVKMDEFSTATGSMFSRGADVSVAKTTATNFVQANFAAVHEKALGGRSSDMKSALDDSCDVMQKVWEQSQCMNFAANPDTDAFFTIKEYVDSAASDKRFEASCPKVEKWQTEWDALLPENTQWDEDFIITFLSEFETEDADDCEQSLQVATGVSVVPSDGSDPYDAKVCVKAGCVYASSGECHGPCEPGKVWDGSSCAEPG